MSLLGSFRFIVTPKLLFYRYSIPSLSWHLRKLLLMQIMLQSWGLLAMRFVIDVYNKKTSLILVLVDIKLLTFGSYLVHRAVLPQLDWQQVGSYPIKAHYSFVNMHSAGLYSWYLNLFLHLSVEYAFYVY